jgi:CRP-like cAMP-binding protein
LLRENISYILVFVHSISDLTVSGDEGDQFYIVESGVAEVYRGKAIIPENMQATLQRGDTFGENALRRARALPRTASVIAKFVLCFGVAHDLGLTVCC